MRQEIESCSNLAQVVKVIFGKEWLGRTILLKEGMGGEVAKAYDKLGRECRRVTYTQVANDLKKRTDYYKKVQSQDLLNMLEVGCGSGLLSLELAEQTNAQVVGIDSSADMIHLARDNLNQRLEQQERTVEEFGRKIPLYCATKNIPSKLDLKLELGNVYTLENLFEVERFDYIVCRNSLHRFHEPKKALQQMLRVLKPKGQIYLRDLRRDADWNIIVKRIGEERWKSPDLIRDYLGAMAQMFTIEEVDNLFRSVGIRDYTIDSGDYASENKTNRFNEFEKEMEWVAVIKE